MNKKKYPLKMNPYYKETVWGGDALSKRFGKECGKSTGEAWEVSTRCGFESTIASGEYIGMTLGSYLGTDDFPLLIKFIDAADKLSVQVHPAEKNELWYVIDALPDSEIIYGTVSGIGMDDIINAGDNIEKYLNRISVKAGDVFYIPSGQIHALGSGILVAEIQQNSDTTYRLYDYGRPRELHREKAHSVIKLRSDDDIFKLRYSKGFEGLANNEYFTVSEHYGQTDFNSIDSDSVIIAIDGVGSLSCGGEKYTIQAGDTYLLPVGCPDTKLCGNVKVLKAKSAFSL